MNNVLAFKQQSSSTYFPLHLKGYVGRDNTNRPGGTGMIVTGTPEQFPRKLMNKGIIILRELKDTIPNLSILIEHI